MNSPFRGAAMSTASSCGQAEEQVKRLPKAPLRQTPLPLPRTKVGMVSLGCAKNLVDAEIMLGSVLQRGMEITSRAEDADVLVVNTCAFIDSAKEESIGAILEAHQRRGLNKKSGQNSSSAAACRNGLHASCEKKCRKSTRSLDWIKSVSLG